MQRSRSYLIVSLIIYGILTLIIIIVIIYLPYQKYTRNLQHFFFGEETSRNHRAYWTGHLEFDCIYKWVLRICG